MKKYAKLICAILALAMALGLAACGSASQPAEPAATAEPAASAEPEAPAEPEE